MLIVAGEIPGPWTSVTALNIMTVPCNNITLHSTVCILNFIIIFIIIIIIIIQP